MFAQGKGAAYLLALREIRLPQVSIRPTRVMNLADACAQR
jgi:hypothetical protein